MDLVCFYIGMSLWLQVPGVGNLNMDHADKIKETERGLVVCTPNNFCFPIPGATIDDLANCGKGKAA